MTGRRFTSRDLASIPAAIYTGPLPAWLYTPEADAVATWAVAASVAEARAYAHADVGDHVSARLAELDVEAADDAVVMFDRMLTRRLELDR